jgi:hypothetical protein
MYGCQNAIDDDDLTTWTPGVGPLDSYGNPIEPIATDEAWITIKFAEPMSVGCISAANLGEGGQGWHAYDSGLNVRVSDDGVSWTGLAPNEPAAAALGVDKNYFITTTDNFEGEACTGVDCTSSFTCPQGSFPRSCQTTPLNSGAGAFVSPETLACIAKGTSDGVGTIKARVDCSGSSEVEVASSNEGFLDGQVVTATCRKGSSVISCNCHSPWGMSVCGGTAEFEPVGDRCMKDIAPGPGAKIFALCRKGSGSETCSEGYTRQPGDVQGWGKINLRGGGEIVKDCDDCGTLCDGISSCVSYECSPTERKCNLNDSGMRTSFTDYADYMYCRKGVPYCESVNNKLPFNEEY